jgi:hypothetical protein
MFYVPKRKGATNAEDGVSRAPLSFGVSAGWGKSCKTHSVMTPVNLSEALKKNLLPESTPKCLLITGALEGASPGFSLLHLCGFPFLLSITQRGNIVQHLSVFCLLASTL